jgi:dihydropteroate synthase
MPTYHANPEDDALQRRKNREFKKVVATKADITWNQDEQAYFTIMPYLHAGKLLVRVYGKDHQKRYLIEGKTPEAVYHRIIRMDLVSRLDHAAYLGKELEKAYVALKQGALYVQDDELDLTKRIRKASKKKPAAR